MYHRGFQLLVTASIVPSSPIPVTLMMEVILSPETLILTRTTRCHIPEDSIFLVLVSWLFVWCVNWKALADPYYVLMRTWKM
jgi:hypothetical protein